MDLSAFFKLIRWKNLLLILYTQLLLKYYFFTSFNITTKLTDFQFFILIFSIILITASGYIINDIFDINTDLINKPEKVIISKKITVDKGKKLYLLINTIGIALGIYLSLNIQKPTFSFLFIGASLLLYYYSKNFKSKPLIGNVIVSFLIAISILIIIWFDIDFSIKTHSQQLIIYSVWFLSFFAFFLNLIREIIKDIEDINGDYALNMNTLPILVGRKRTRYLASVICAFPLSLLLFILIKYSFEYKFTMLYLLIGTFLPILYVAIKLLNVKTPKNLNKLSTLLKIIMFLGINSLVILSLKL